MLGIVLWALCWVYKFLYEVRWQRYTWARPAPVSCWSFLVAHTGAGHELAAYAGSWLLELSRMAGAKRHAGEHSTVQQNGQTAATDTACRLYSNIHCCIANPAFSTASLASQLCWELDLLIASWRWRTDWRPDMLLTAAGVGWQLVLTERVMLIVKECQSLAKIVHHRYLNGIWLQWNGKFLMEICLVRFHCVPTLLACLTNDMDSMLQQKDSILKLNLSGSAWHCQYNCVSVRHTFVLHSCELPYC